MCTIRHSLSAALVVVLTITTMGAGLSVSAQERPYRVSQQQEVDQLLRRIETRSTQFRQSLYAALNQSRIDGTRQEDNINEFVRNFETATANLRDRFRQRRDVAGDVSEVLTQAAFIDRKLARTVEVASGIGSSFSVASVMIPSIPSEPHIKPVRSKPTTFFTVFPPVRMTSPVAVTTSNPRT